jgi:hypothetical protein
VAVRRFQSEVTVSSFGFVYIMANPCMPDAYKFGCTERSPHMRADELSGSTGVPKDFYVVCYLECLDFQSVEKSLHRYAANYRISQSREFFRRDCVLHAMGFLQGHPSLLCFSVVDFSVVWQLSDEKISSLHDLPNPWSGADGEPQPLPCIKVGLRPGRLPAELRVVCGARDA